MLLLPPTTPQTDTPCSPQNRTCTPAQPVCKSNMLLALKVFALFRNIAAAVEGPPFPRATITKGTPPPRLLITPLTSAATQLMVFARDDLREL
jgi:hypothetical protein